MFTHTAQPHSSDTSSVPPVPSPEEAKEDDQELGPCTQSSSLSGHGRNDPDYRRCPSVNPFSKLTNKACFEKETRAHTLKALWVEKKLTRHCFLPECSKIPSGGQDLGTAIRVWSGQCSCWASLPCSTPWSSWQLWTFADPCTHCPLRATTK